MGMDVLGLYEIAADRFFEQGDYDRALEYVITKSIFGSLKRNFSFIKQQAIPFIQR
jgi:hypothetical protein